MLARIHRPNDDRWWTESCLRLRDFVMSYEGDYEVWLRHDLDRGHLSAEQQKYFQIEAVWLCTRCEDVGRENGKQLAHKALDKKRPVHRIYVRHSSHKSAKHHFRDFVQLEPICISSDLRSMTATGPASLRTTVRGPFTFLEHT